MGGVELAWVVYLRAHELRHARLAAPEIAADLETVEQKDGMRCLVRNQSAFENGEAFDRDDAAVGTAAADALESAPVME